MHLFGLATFATLLLSESGLAAAWRTPWSGIDPEFQHCSLEGRSVHDERSSVPELPELFRRQSGGGTVDGSGSAGVGVGVGSVSAGVGIGNINITVGNVTVEAGNIDVENINIGNISVLVSVALNGQTAVPTSVGFPSTSISSSSQPSTTVTDGSTLTTITPTPATTPPPPPPGVHRRQAGDPTVSGSVSASATASVGPVGVNAAVGNITLTVGNIFVKIGDITLKNVTIGNVLVAIQLGQGDALNNLTSAAGGLLGQ